MRTVLGIVVFLILFSCKEKLIEPPEDLIPVDKMTDILYDLSLLKGMKSTDPATFDKHQLENMPYLYGKYGVDSTQFVLSDAYYASNPEIYQSIYETIEDRLKQKIKVIEDAKKQKNDSIKKRTERIRDSLKSNKKGTPTQIPSKK